MEEKARAVEDETQRLLSSGEGFRVDGSTERPAEGPPVTTIAVLIRLFRTGRRLQTGQMDRAMALVRELMDRGHPVNFQECAGSSAREKSGRPTPRRRRGISRTLWKGDDHMTEQVRSDGVMGLMTDPMPTRQRPEAGEAAEAADIERTRWDGVLFGESSLRRGWGNGV